MNTAVRCRFPIHQQHHDLDPRVHMCLPFRSIQSCLDATFGMVYEQLRQKAFCRGAAAGRQQHQQQRGTTTLAGGAAAAAVASTATVEGSEGAGGGRAAGPVSAAPAGEDAAAVAAAAAAAAAGDGGGSGRPAAAAAAAAGGAGVTGGVGGVGLAGGPAVAEGEESAQVSSVPLACCRAPVEGVFEGGFEDELLYAYEYWYPSARYQRRKRCVVLTNLLYSSSAAFAVLWLFFRFFPSGRVCVCVLFLFFRLPSGLLRVRVLRIALSPFWFSGLSKLNECYNLLASRGLHAGPGHGDLPGQTGG